MPKRIYFKSGAKKIGRAKLRWQTRQTRQRSLDSLDAWCRAQLERLQPLAREVSNVEYPLTADAAPKARMSDYELIESRK